MKSGVGVRGSMHHVAGPKGFAWGERLDIVTARGAGAAAVLAVI